MFLIMVNTLKYIVFVVVFLTAALSTQAMAGEQTYGDMVGTVVSVYDGDTMTVTIPDVPAILGDAIPIRVRGIDTPEMHDKRPDIHALAIQARDAVRAWCPVGSTVELRGVGRDKYFRLDATLICGGVDIAAELVKSGLAHGDYDGGTKVPW